MINSKSLPVGLSNFLYNEQKMFVSVVPKKNKCVPLIYEYTMHFTDEINKHIKNPETVKFFNATKGGVNVFDKLCQRNPWVEKQTASLCGTLRDRRYSGFGTYVIHKLNCPNLLRFL